jgi:uncharacterized protein (TIGR04255 family)
MSEQPPLPRFKKPPVSEVVVGVQFQAPPLSPVHLGLYYLRVKDRFPIVNVQPPLPPVFETFGPTQPIQIGFPFFPIEGGVSPLQPRMWFLAKDNSSLIQLQSGRLLFNWRTGTDNSAYPHFDTVYAEFIRALDELEALAMSEELGSVLVNQCEVVYVNPLSANVTGVPLSNPERIFRSWSISALGEEWREPLEDLSFNARYRFTDENGNPFGRLAVSLSPGWLPDGTPAFNLQLTARGIPRAAGREGIVAFHDYAHRAIVRSFAGLTTPEMHALWERYQ